MQVLRLFIRVIDRINEWIGIVISMLLPAIVTVLASEVVARYVFKRPTIWAYDMAIFMFGYCGLLAGAYVLRHKEHINVDILYVQLSTRWKAILDTLTGVLCFYFIILVILYGWKMALSSLALKGRSATEWGPPVGHFKLMIPIGAFLLLLQGLANWIRSFYRAITDKELEV